MASGSCRAEGACAGAQSHWPVPEAILACEGIQEILSGSARYFMRWSEINAASSSASTTPSRVRISLPRAKKCVVG